MSVSAMSAVFKARGLSPAKRVILLALADQGDDAGYSWLGLETVAQIAELDPRHTRRLMIDLVAGGYADVVYQGGGRGRPSLYRVLPLVLPDDADSKSRLAYERRFEIKRNPGNLSPLPIGERGAPARGKGGAGARKGGRPRPGTHKDTERHADVVSLRSPESELADIDLPPRNEGESIADYVVRIAESKENGAS